MTVQEFMECGLLQEINRRIMHPIGLALSVKMEKGADLSTLEFGDILDRRDDPVGFVFGDLTCQTDLDKYAKVEAMLESKWPARVKKFGWLVQPIDTILDKSQLE